MSTPTPLSKANTTFSLALFKKLSDEDKTKNIFYSPFSISSALAMVMLGTRGNTATQMSEALCFTKAEQPTQPEVQQCQFPSQMPLQVQMRTCTRTQQQTQPSSGLQQCLSQELKPQSGQDDDVHASFAELLSDLNKPEAPYALSLANRLYGEQSYQFHEEYLADTLKYYEAELESVDFKTSAELARVNINTWVEEKTQGKIKDLLVQGVVDDMTRLVLVNAIYFKGLWDERFKKENTVTLDFKINKNDKKQVMMMHQKRKFPFNVISETGFQVQILEMPYKGKDLSMLIFLPSENEDDTTDLEKLEEKLNYENFVKWTDKMTPEEVEVNLPRFKMAETYGLNDVLISMGMTDAFDALMSDFSGMSPANDLLLSKVVHKSFVEVNEEGTEAAAATGAVVTTRSAKHIKFIADHPFLFFIRHNITKSILFAGRCCSPE